MNESRSHAVRRAAASLDTEFSTFNPWWSQVNLRRLDMTCDQHCVLGQLYGACSSFEAQSAIQHRGIPHSAVDPSSRVESWLLGRAWKREIRARRSARSRG